MGELLGRDAEQGRGCFVEGAQPEVARVVDDAHAHHVPIDVLRVDAIARLAEPPPPRMAVLVLLAAVVLHLLVALGPWAARVPHGRRPYLVHCTHQPHVLLREDDDEGETHDKMRVKEKEKEKGGMIIP